MSLPTSRLIQAAVDRGLTVATPVLLTMDGPEHIRVNVIISHAEPVSVVAPLDLLWINPDTGSPLRRVSRAQSQDFVHTWEVADETSFWLAQSWDEPRPVDQDFHELNRNIGNTHGLILADIGALGVEGGDLTGPLRPRVLEVGDDYAPAEAVPRSFVEKLTMAAQSLAASVSQQLTSTRNALTAVRNRVTVVEQELESIQLGDGTPRYKHDQVEPALEWIIVHNLHVPDITVRVVREDGTLMIPATETMVDEDTLRLTFAEARQGRALILGIR